MRDTISIARVNALHPKIISSIISFIEDVENTLNLTLRTAQGLRTFAEQTALYNQGRFGNPGEIVTYSPAGTSYHNYGLAVDEVIVNSDGSIDWNFDYTQLVPFATKYGLTAGITFPHKDSDHFENNYGNNWRILLHKYQNNDFIAGTTFVNINE